MDAMTSSIAQKLQAVWCVKGEILAAAGVFTINVGGPTAAASPMRRPSRMTENAATYSTTAVTLCTVEGALTARRAVSEDRRSVVLRRANRSMRRSPAQTNVVG